MSFPSRFSSYTTFSYSNLVVSPSAIIAGENVTVKVTVSNTGNVDGDEVGVVMTSSLVGVAMTSSLVPYCINPLPTSL